MGVIAIVGHGPSLRGAGKGEYIDSFDYVVRFPYSGNWQIPEDYGTLQPISLYGASKLAG